MKFNKKKNQKYSHAVINYHQNHSKVITILQEFNMKFVMVCIADWFLDFFLSQIDQSIVIFFCLNFWEKFIAPTPGHSVWSFNMKCMQESN